MFTRFTRFALCAGLLLATAACGGDEHPSTNPPAGHGGGSPGPIEPNQPVQDTVRLDN